MPYVDHGQRPSRWRRLGDYAGPIATAALACFVFGAYIAKIAAEDHAGHVSHESPFVGDTPGDPIAFSSTSAADAAEWSFDSDGEIRFSGPRLTRCIAAAHVPIEPGMIVVAVDDEGRSIEYGWTGRGFVALMDGRR